MRIGTSPPTARLPDVAGRFCSLDGVRLPPLEWEYDPSVRQASKVRRRLGQGIPNISLIDDVVAIIHCACSVPTDLHGHGREFRSAGFQPEFCRISARS